MAFTEEQKYKIEILEDGIIQVRRSDIVLKDGVEIGRQYHRHVLTPGQDVTAEIQRVRDVANVVWTTDVVNAYTAQQAAASPDADPAPDNSSDSSY